MYGFCPPVIVKPHSSHVDRVSVTLGLIVAILDVSMEDGRHDVSLPARRLINNCEGRITLHTPTVLYSGASTPPIPLDVVFESTMVIIKLEPIIDDLSPRLCRRIWTYLACACFSTTGSRYQSPGSSWSGHRPPRRRSSSTAGRQGARDCRRETGPGLAEFGILGVLD